MIYISEDELQQVEYLIEQSIQGNHILFDPDRVIDAFLSEPPPAMKKTDAYSVEHHIERLITRPTLLEKRAYMEMLDASTQRLIIRTYFNIVENNLFESQGMKH